MCMAFSSLCQSVHRVVIDDEHHEVEQPDVVPM